MPAFRVKDLTDARAALAKVLTSSVSKRTLINRLKKSTAFSKLPHSASYTPTSYKFSDNVAFRTELPSVLKSDLPMKNEWAEPTRRQGLTTFKVVPPQKPILVEAEVTVEARGASPEDSISQTEAQEDPCSSESSKNDKFSDKVIFDTELESVLKSDLPTENNWADPTRRRGLTTFKVVPPKKPILVEAETQGAHPEGGASPEDSTCQTETQEDRCSSDRLENKVTSSSPRRSSEGTQSPPPPPEVCVDHNTPSEVEEFTGSQHEVEEPEVTPTDTCEGESTNELDVNLRNQEESVQSPSEDSEERSSCPDDKAVSEVVGQEEEEDDEEEGVSFPPPPPPVFFNEDLDTMEERPAPASTTQSPSPTINGQRETPECPSAAPRRSLNTSASSRFAQAVAMAVQRARRQSHGKTSGPQVSNGSAPSSPRSTYQYGA